jgi:hypothetical protein
MNRHNQLVKMSCLARPPFLFREFQAAFLAAATVLCVKAVAVFYSVGKQNTYALAVERKGCRSRIIALRMVSNLRMQAVRATFLSLPRFSNCW